MPPGKVPYPKAKTNPPPLYRYVDGVLSRGVLTKDGSRASSLYQIFLTSTPMACPGAHTSVVLTNAPPAFTLGLIQNLVIFGYAIWRPLTEEGDPDPVYQVPTGRHVSVRFDKETLTWVPDFHSTANTAVDLANEDSEEWKVIMLTPPLESRPDGYGSRAGHDARRIEEMYENQAKRDSFNSVPSCFTTIDDNLFQTRGRAGGQGWLTTGLDIDPQTGMEGSTRSLGT